MIDTLHQKPLISVIMNCLNSEKYLREAIDSVYAQTYTNWEIIFWDNAGSDGSAAIAQSYDEKLRYFRGSSTVPLGAARNRAIEQACGEYLAFLDCDDLWLPTKLEKQLPLFNDPAVDVVYSDALYFNALGQCHRLYGRRPYYVGDCFGELLVNYCIALLTVIIRRNALDRQPHWFDERFQVSEESELFLRLAYTHKLAMFNEPLAKYRVHAESWTFTRPELFEQERELMLQKFQELLPEFTTAYASHIKALRTRSAFAKAKQLWIAGHGAAARVTLKPYLNNVRTSLLYVSSFAPAVLGRLIDQRWNVLPK